MMIRKKRGEKSSLALSINIESHNKRIKSPFQNDYLNYSEKNSEKILLKNNFENKNLPIKVQIKTTIKKESKLDINSIQGKKIFSLSFKKPDSSITINKLNFQEINKKEKDDNNSYIIGPYQKTINKKLYQSNNYKKLLLNSFNDKIFEENNKSGLEDNNQNDDTNDFIKNNKKHKLKDLLNSPKNKLVKRKKCINSSSMSPIITYQYNISNDENNKDNNENENKENINKIKIIMNKNFVFNKPKANNINSMDNTNKRKINNYQYKHIDSFTNILDSNSNIIKNIKKSTDINKNNIINDNKIIKSDRESQLNNNNNDNNTMINNLMKNIKIISSNEKNKKDLLSPKKSLNNSNTNINILNSSFQLNNKIKEKEEDIIQKKFNGTSKNFNKKINKKIDIKIEDLIIIEERLNDIYIALNRSNISNDNCASNECIEFFAFYFHSTLKYSFPYFFNKDNNKLVISSAINLNLFIVLIIYHLSMNLSLFNELLPILLNIFELLKLNLYLIIKQVQIYYGDSYLLKNDIYFKTFNYIFKKNNIMNIDEEEICLKIKNNCIQIVNFVNDILNYYKKINNIYYIDFFEIFNRISVINEKDLNNYFYHHLYFQTGNPPPEPNKIYKGENKKMISKGISTKNINKEKIKNILIDYKLKQVKPPFLKTPCNKKYTLILDLDETLVNVIINENTNNDTSKYIFNLRPGLFSFLNGVKPYYELITFTNASKEYSDIIISQIEKNKKYFDYNFYREHSVLLGNEFIKDISRIGRDIKKMIIVDNVENNFILNKENGILIAPFKIDRIKNDTKLFHLKNILLKFNNNNYEDLRIALKDFSNDIKNKITLDNELI